MYPFYSEIALSEDKALVSTKKHFLSYFSTETYVVGTVNVLKFQSKASDKMAYTKYAHPGLTAPKGAVWSGSTLPFHL